MSLEALASQSSVVAPAATEEGASLITKKNVALALLAVVVVIGLGFVIYKLVVDYRAKKVAKPVEAKKPDAPVAVVPAPTAPIQPDQKPAAPEAPLSASPTAQVAPTAAPAMDANATRQVVAKAG